MTPRLSTHGVPATRNATKAGGSLANFAGAIAYISRQAIAHLIEQSFSRQASPKMSSSHAHSPSKERWGRPNHIFFYSPASETVFPEPEKGSAEVANAG